jgi:phytoene synthase
MINKIFRDIFKAGSRTYFYSSLFFPREIKQDVFILYGFVRQADNFVDSISQDRDGFFAFKQRYEKALESNTVNDAVIDSFVELMKRRKFDKQWIEAFLRSMEMDLYKKTYQTLDETEEYIYGSAEVIGLMMARILGLKEESLPAARLQGKAMQYINFIRDIKEDLALGRTYLPQQVFKKYQLSSLEFDEVKDKKQQFCRFIRAEINRYKGWQQEAQKGYRYIPWRYLICIKTAADMYDWTARQIEKNPLVVFDRKVKPSRSRIIGKAIINMFNLGMGKHAEDKSN